MESNPKQLISIQYLRAIAALMVVIHHSRISREWLFNPLRAYEGFSGGVDIFFVLSGFIMFTAARNQDHADFLVKRVIRIVPLYWIATFALLVVNTQFHMLKVGTDGFNHLVKSLLLIPHYSLSKPEYIWPYLKLGWTLNYEMFFYIIFFLGLFIKRVLFTSTLIIILLFLLGLIFQPQNAILKTYTNSILLEFLCGVFISVAFIRGAFNNTIRPVVIIGFILLLLAPIYKDKLGELTVAFTAIASSMIVIGALLLNKKVLRIKLLHLLGDASYSIYLTHIIPIRYCENIWKHVPLDGWLQFTSWMIVVLVSTSIVGIAVHLYIEKPMLKYFRLKWQGH